MPKRVLKNKFDDDYTIKNMQEAELSFEKQSPLEIVPFSLQSTSILPLVRKNDKPKIVMLNNNIDDTIEFVP